MNPVIAQAVEESRRVARAVRALGRSGTVAEIAGAGGLDREMVIRRLRGSAQFSPPTTRYFSFDKLSGRWGLTARGVEFAEGR
jgi:hypothetical protein